MQKMNAIAYEVRRAATLGKPRKNCDERSNLMGTDTFIAEEDHGMTFRSPQVLGYNLLELCLHGPQEKLNQTQFAQPVLP